MDRSPSSVSEAQRWYEARIRALKSLCSSTEEEEEDEFHQTSPKSEQRPRTASRVISELQQKG